MSLEKRGSNNQLELFENRFDKKNRVEKAVLELKKKDPSFRVIKASLLNRKK